jgi:hypothetical protein
MDGINHRIMRECRLSLMQRATLTIAVVFGLLACKNEPRDKPIAAHSKPTEPKMIPGRDELPATNGGPAVVLPPSPEPSDVGFPEVPLRYEDGAYSVRGLREDFSARIQAGKANEPIRLRGWVQSVETPLPACPRAGSCDPPHFWLTDAPEIRGRRRAMLVGPLRFAIPDWDEESWVGVPELDVQVGREVVCKGMFTVRSRHHLRDARGMLELEACQDDSGDWIIPRGASWHPKAPAPVP